MERMPGPGVRGVRGNGQRRDVFDVATSGCRGTLLGGGHRGGAADLATGGFGLGRHLRYRDVLPGSPLGTDQPGDLIRRRTGVTVGNGLIAHLSSWTSRYTT